MVKVANRGIIRKLSLRNFKAQRNRNLVAIIAIALTALLFTSVTTIGGSLLTTIQDNSFRMVGTSLHAGYKYLTEDTAEQVMDDPEVSDVGYRILAGLVLEDAFSKMMVEFSYMDEQYANTSFVVPTQGQFPQDATEILVADTILDALALPQVLGQSIPLTVEIAGEVQQIEFTVSGIYEMDSVVHATQIVVSRAFIDQYVPVWRGDSSAEHLAKMTEGYGFSAGSVMLNFNFPSAVGIDYQMDQLEQRMDFPPHTADPGVNWAYVSDEVDPTFVLMVVAVSLLITFSGYLIIYNIFLISVSQDVHFYGLLKTIGTTPRQLRRIVYQQALVLFAIGTPLGLVIGYYVGIWLMPILLTNTVLDTFVATQDSRVFLCSALFSLVTVLISCRKPAKFVGKLSPIEAIRHTEGAVKVKNAGQLGKLSPQTMARANLRRNRKKTALVIVSLSLSGVIFNSTYAYVTGFDMEEFVGRFAVTDFLVSSESILHYQYGSGMVRGLEGVTPEVQGALASMSGIEETGRVYVTETRHSLSPQAKANVEQALEQYGDEINPPVH